MLKNITMLKNMWNGNDDFKHCLWNAELDLIYAKDQKDSLCFVLQIKFGKKKGDSKTQSKLKKQVCPFFTCKRHAVLLKNQLKSLTIQNMLSEVFVTLKKLFYYKNV